MIHKDIKSSDRLIFAMDVPDCDRARALAEELGDAVTFYKLGLELMMSGGYFELLDWMLARNKQVFADLKFFDVPATVGSAVRQLKDRGASFVTVHGNQAIMEAAAANKGEHLKVLAVTVLTSLDRGDLDDLRRRHPSTRAPLHGSSGGLSPSRTRDGSRGYRHRLPGNRHGYRRPGCR